MTMSMRSFLAMIGAVLGAVVCAAALLVGLATPAAAAACSPQDAVPGDFNGDGHADAAVGEPGRGGASGGVHVLYGTADGLTADADGTAPDDQLFTQDTPGIVGTAENGDEFGSAIAVGDFNGDQCADVAIGAPGENNDSGVVAVLYGSAGTGLSAAGNQYLSQTYSLPSTSEPGDRLGATLAAGSFNNDTDGITDLAAGGPGEAIGAGHDEGAVWVLYGDAAGLDQGAGAEIMHQGTPDVPGVPESGDRFGEALAFGFFRGDCLAVGVPGENDDAGAVEIFRGDGITDVRSFWQNTPRVPGAAEPGDRFGAALAAGDTTGFGYDDLAVGVPGENADRGAVTLMQSSEDGVLSEHSEDPLWFSQSTPGIGGGARPDDEFGAALEMGRLDGGEFTADLAVGVPGDGIGFGGGVGTVSVLYGNLNGLSASGSTRYHQNVDGLGGGSEIGDRFGFSLSALPIQNSGIDNLLIGVPLENGGNVSNSGLFHVLTTNEFGPSTAGSQTWSAASTGVKGALIPSGRLGRDLD